MGFDVLRATRAALGCGAAALAVIVARDAFAFCRTTTCELSPGFAPSGDSCYPPADQFAADCYCTTNTDFEDCLTAYAQMSPKPVVTAHLLWWRNACVSYDVNQDASVQVPYDTADEIAATSFSKWTGAQCPIEGGVEGGVGRASIDVRDLGPVECNEVQYNQNQGNQHVIIFHDDDWPYSDSANTLGLTTVTFDPDTGEIFDADMEINATVPLAVSDPVPPNAYDLQSIMTHESGHFLGLAHTPDSDATMYAYYTLGSTTKRVLSPDDMAGICSIYPPGATRGAETWTSDDDAGWTVAAPIAETACDPTPRNGFQSACSVPQSSSCSMGTPRSGSGLGFLSLAGGFFGAGLARRRPRRAAMAGRKP